MAPGGNKIKILKPSCIKPGGNVEGKDDDGRGAACSKKAIWDCSVASPGFAELLDVLVLRMEVFPFSAFFIIFFFFVFGLCLPRKFFSF